MEIKVKRFLRLTPKNHLQSFLKNYNLELPQDFKWQDSGKKYFDPLLNSIWSIENKRRRHLFDIVERIDNMKDELGQSTLFSVIGANENFLSLEGEFARSLWVIINHPDKFREAEQHIFLDSKRKSRQWSRYLTANNKEIDKSPQNIERFKQEVLNSISISKRMKIEFFERNRFDDGKEAKLFQLTVFHEELQKTVLVLDEQGSEIIPQYFYPVNELAITYQADNGVIEVVCPYKDSRTILAKAFANTFLKDNSTAIVPIKLNQYDLEKLKYKYDFMKDVDLEDSIEDVRVTMIKLKPHGVKSSVSLESPFNSQKSRSVYDLAHSWFPQNNPLNSDFEIKQVKLSIKFKSDSKYPRGKLLHVTITSPNNCDLKDKTQKERLIGNKYLKRWGLLSKYD